ncbi:MAG: tagaturonate reductase [Lachnospiraceae bacterium]|nr:tagaturonate reductase [Lachnospiraceae bacterium]
MKEKIIQFGEGGFLRSFADMFVHIMNEKGVFDGKVVVVQPIEKGLVDVLNAQNGVYHQYLRGIENGEVINSVTEVRSVSRGINPYTDYQEYLSLARNPDMRFIISNTTEAGIEYLDTESLNDAPPKSFPAKLTALLYERYKCGLPGFILFCCELIDHNADLLKEYVMKYAALWELPKEFTAWLEKENRFCNTLVDRICTGYPKDEAEQLCRGLGCEDRLLNTAEVFHLWVIEGNFENEFPLKSAGINVIWTDDVTPYKKRKVRILNGAHTSMVLAARLYGLSTVKECLDEPNVSAFLKKALFEEIIPTLGGSDEDIAFGNAVLERFANPFVKHQLLSIALNSVSKFRARVLPTILEYREKYGRLPKCLTMSLWALIAFYRTDEANDNEEIVRFMKTASVSEILEREDYWGTNLSFMLPDISSLSIPIEPGKDDFYREALL